MLCNISNRHSESCSRNIYPYQILLGIDWQILNNLARSNSPRRLVLPENIVSLNFSCNNLLFDAAKGPKRHKICVMEYLHINGKWPNISVIIKRGLDKRARISYYLFIPKNATVMRVKWRLIWKLLPIKLKIFQSINIFPHGTCGCYF